MNKYLDPFEEFRRKRECEKLRASIAKSKKSKIIEKLDSFDGLHISSFFKDKKGNCDNGKSGSNNSFPG